MAESASEMQGPSLDDPDDFASFWAEGLLDLPDDIGHSLAEEELQPGFAPNFQQDFNLDDVMAEFSLPDGGSRTPRVDTPCQEERDVLDWMVEVPEARAVEDSMIVGEQYSGTVVPTIGDEQLNADDDAVAGAEISAQGDHNIEFPDAPVYARRDVTDSYLAEEPGVRLLRSQAGKRSLGLTWYDDDNTGNYDPDEELRKDRAKRRRPNATGRCRPARVASANVPEPPPSLTILLKFDTIEGQTGLAEIVAAAGRDQPDDNDQSIRWSLRQREKERAQEQSELNSLVGHPRARGCVACLRLGGDLQDESLEQCSLLEDETRWPCKTCEIDGECCVLVVPPVQKLKCDYCRSRRRRCSYQETRNHVGPCSICAEKGWECTAGPAKDWIRRRIRMSADGKSLLLPPKTQEKQAPALCSDDCGECLEAKLECIYTDYESGAACERCRAECLPCTIGELQKDVPNGPSDKSSGSGLQLVEECAQTEPVEECAQTAPVEECAQIEPVEECAQIEPVEATSRESLDHVPTQIPPPTAPVARPESRITPTLNSQPKPMMKHDRDKIGGTKVSSSTQSPPTRPHVQPTQHIITTKFVHPVIFNCGSSDGKEQDCMFCSMPTIALLGGSTRKVQVADFGDDRPYREVLQDRKYGTGQTIICSSCTTRRISWISCPQHEMQIITSIASKKLNPMVAVYEIARGQVKDSNRYCFVCWNFASYECCAPRSTGNSGLSSRQGCGLRLCLTCTKLLKDVGRGNLQNMLSKMNPVQNIGPGYLRADLELLQRGGVLERHMRSILRLARQFMGMGMESVEARRHKIAKSSSK